MGTHVSIANSLYFKNYDEFNWVKTIYKGNTCLIVLTLLYLYYSQITIHNGSMNRPIALTPMLDNVDYKNKGFKGDGKPHLLRWRWIVPFVVKFLNIKC
ncbi:hypothetical protein J5U21_00556 [Saccharolobus shibatae]|uniref:Uncharacterized protein n=1 Tax=Saccharolobus shibatae TaxID=2286 RepID=A0A8F5BSZ3_9CREN|nr:hypothetical protein J5U21_00556 [Saccharolobus shibatae]